MAKAFVESVEGRRRVRQVIERWDKVRQKKNTIVSEHAVDNVHTPFRAGGGGGGRGGLSPVPVRVFSVCKETRQEISFQQQKRKRIKY